MKNIEILLRDDVADLGRCGDVLTVRPGYARNYLFPKGLAVGATGENKRLMARRRLRLDSEQAVVAAERGEFAKRLSQVRVTTAAKADESGSLYGSVSGARIVELLAGAGHVVAEKDVRLAAPLKQVGEHSVVVHVHGDLEATVTVVIESEA